MDIKKVITTPTNEFDAIDALTKCEQSLISAIHILQSVIDNQDKEYWEYHEKRIKNFLSQFD